MSKQQPCADYLGNEFPSIKAMCKYWNISAETYSSRIKSGWTQKQALTTPKMKYTDHKGNKFKSKSAMCRYWGINDGTFDSRIKNGMTQEQALTAPKQETVVSKSCTDHLGNKFPSISAMCEYWNNIDISIYNERRKNGWTQEKALTTPSTSRPIPKSETKLRTDCFGNTFKNIQKMCDHHNTSCKRYYKRINKGYSQIEALGVIPLLNNQTKNAKITDTITIIKHANIDDKRKFFLCSIRNSSEAILSRNTILKYAIEYHTAKKAELAETA